MRRAILLVLLLTLPLSVKVGAAEEDIPSIIISEIFVSPNSMTNNDTCNNCYGATDWNGDGKYGRDSDQFIEITNTGDTDVDISDWWLDDSLTAGSPGCRIGWNTTIFAGESISFYVADTGIRLSYYDGGPINLLNSDMIQVATFSFPAKDSWYGKSYVPNATSGGLDKVDPTPADFQGRCYNEKDTEHQGSFWLKGRVVTMVAENEVFNNGAIKVVDGRIAEVGDASIIPANESIPIHESDGTIYPGLIDMHNHLHYNQVPLWDMDTHLYPANRNQWGGYQNRYQWGDNDDYSPMVTKPKMLIHGDSYWGMGSQAMKYVEVKTIVGGTTAVQGGPTSNLDPFDSILARNIEFWNWERDWVHTKVTELTDDYIGNHIKNGNNSGQLDAWFIHLAEGVDEKSRAEFDILVANDLLVGEVVIIHGTALTSVEFEKLAEVGGSLVWSPLSNLLLYGQTTDVKAAKQAGVRISISPDWSPSGSKSPLHELKVADLWDDEVLGGIFSDYEMVEMVTSNSADAMGWKAHVGRIMTGRAADLVVIDNNHQDPYRNLIDAIDPDVRLTMVGGLAIYGDTDLMTEFKGNDIEEFGNGKSIDVTFSSVEDGMQTWASIVDDLSMAMEFNYSEMEAAFGGVNDFDNLVKNMQPIGLDPIWTFGDQRYFRVLNNSNNANAQIDMSKLYDRWYSRNASLEGVTIIPDDNPEPQPEPEPEPEPSPEENTTEEWDCGKYCVDDSKTSDEQKAENKAFVNVTLFGLLIVLGIGLFFASKMAKKNEFDEPKFIPSPPPMGPPPSEE